MAEEAWHDPNMERVKLAFIDEYEVRLQRHREELHEYDQMMQREALEQQRREMEVQQELPPAPPSREGGVGGFTSING